MEPDSYRRLLEEAVKIIDEHAAGYTVWLERAMDRLESCDSCDGKSPGNCAACDGKCAKPMRVCDRDAGHAGMHSFSERNP